MTERLGIFLAVWAALTMACAGVWLLSQTTYPFWRTVGGASLIASLVAVVLTAIVTADTT